METLQVPSSLHLFDGTGSAATGVDALASFAGSLLARTRVESHGDFVEYCLERCRPDSREDVADEISLEMAAARVTGPAGSRATAAPPAHVVAYERRMLSRKPPRPVGVMYDGLGFCSAYASLRERAGVAPEEPVIVLTDQLFGTLDEGDVNYHARVAVFADPCLISTAGLVQAPARPRDHYIGRQLGLDGAGRDAEGRWLVPGDPRTTEMLKGYVAQALFYFLTGEPFCGERGCRLFNSHWQEELLASQLEGGSDFCVRHERFLSELKGATNG